MSRIKGVLLIIIFLAGSSFVFADKQGEQIARKLFSRKESNDDYGVGNMILIDKNNRKKVRRFKLFSKEARDGRISLLEFLKPADVKGTKFLNIGHKKADDEQRLYLPALGKIRRISSSNKNGSFMGSDLNYYDMEDLDYDDFSKYTYLREENVNGIACYTIERTPNDPDAPYSKQIVSIGKKDYYPYKIQCYDLHNVKNLIKTIMIVEVNVTNGIVSYTKMVVHNHHTNHKTLLQITDLKINPGLSHAIFSIKNLKK